MTLMLWKKKYELPTVAKRIKNWKEAALTHTIHSCSPVREEDVIFQGMHLWDKEEIIQGRIRRANIKKKERKWKDNVPVLILSSKYGVYFYSWCLWYFWPPSGEEHASGGWCPFSLGLRKRNERTIARKEAWSIYKPIQTNTSINCELTGAS